MSDIAVLTRPEGGNKALAQRLVQAGWQVCDWPALTLVAQACEPQCLPRPGSYDLAVFVSGNAARQYLAQLQAAGETQWPASCMAATVGPSSAAALRATGWFAGVTLIHPDATAPTHDSEALWHVLTGRGPLPRRVLIVRGTQGRDWMAEQLRGAGCEVTPHAAYRRVPSQWGDIELAQVRAWRDRAERPTWLLTSGEGIAAVRANIARAQAAPWWRDCHFVVTHPTLAQRLESEEGIGRDAIDVRVSDIDALFAAFVSA